MVRSILSLLLFVSVLVLSSHSARAQTFSDVDVYNSGTYVAVTFTNSCGLVSSSDASRNAVIEFCENLLKDVPGCFFRGYWFGYHRPHSGGQILPADHFVCYIECLDARFLGGLAKSISSPPEVCVPGQ